MISHISDLEFGGVMLSRAISLNLHDSGHLIDVWSCYPSELADYRSVVKRFQVESVIEGINELGNSHGRITVSGSFRRKQKLPIW